MTETPERDINQLVALIRERFLNRDDVVAVLAPWGKPCPASCNGSLDALFRAHVLGAKAPEVEVTCETRKGNVAVRGRFRVGAYAPAKDGTTKWSCVDFDGGSHASALVDAYGAALAFHERLRRLGIPSYLERSGSGTGWHVWVFFDPPVLAEGARKLALLLAPAKLPLAAGGVSDPGGRGVEVFPKQARIRDGGHGNLVWLPWWAGSAPSGNAFYEVSELGVPEPFIPSAFETMSPDDLDHVLRDLGTHEEDPGFETSKESKGSAWPEWRQRALAGLPLESVYGEWLTGRTSGDGWLECRDPGSPSGDRDPSGGVADGTRDVERGSFHSFRIGRTISVFDFLVERGRAKDFRHACALIAELSGVALPDSANLPQIRTDSRQLRDVVRDAWGAIRASNDGPEIFQRTGFLIRLIPGDGGPRIDLLNEDVVYGRLARVANWVRRFGKLVVDTHPPRDVARDMLVYPDPGLPHLDRICLAPVFDPAGTVLLSPRYHAEARIWLHLPEGFRLPPTPDAPSTDVVRLARRLILDELLVDFPFVAISDRAHAIGALLLPYVRNLISGCTPIHDFESPTPGSGKGLLADIISILAAGHPCPATTIARDDDESRKKVTSILARGQSLILIDNVRGALESSALSSAITAEIWSDRVLGQSRMVDLPNLATWIVTANNPRLSLEIARRCVRIRLDPKIDRPWQRTGFKHPNLKEWALAQRPDLIWALFVLVRAWIAAGRPPGPRSLGSFESYAAVIGGILEVAEIPGFLGDIEQLYEQADAEGREWRAFVTVWWAAQGDVWVTAGDLHRLAIDKDLLGRVLGEKGERSQKIRLGIALQSVRDRQFGTFRIVSAPDANAGASRYRLVRAGDPRDSSAPA